jgi:nucleoside-diphosphate-sugar epimerase
MALHIVTGGAGFIGSHLVRGLLAAGHFVRVIDNFSTGHRENLAGLPEDHLPRLAVIEGCVTDVDSLRRHFAGADTVFHQRPCPRSRNRSRIRSQQSLTTSTAPGGAGRGARAASGGGVAASSSAYGDTTLRKWRPCQRALSPYALTKFASEEYARIFHQVYGLETVSLRYFNIFGPRQDPASQYAAVIASFIDRMLRGEPPVIYGDGSQSRDFTYVDNVVRANLLAAAAPSQACGRVYNIACGRRIDLNELVGLLNEILGTRLAPRHDPPRPGDILHSLADIGRAREVLGYEPRVDVTEGLRRTVDWYRSLGAPEPN